MSVVLEFASDLRPIAEILLKVTLLLGLDCLAGLAARHADAKHSALLMRAAMVCVVAAPLFVLAVPGIRVAPQRAIPSARAAAIQTAGAVRDVIIHPRNRATTRLASNDARAPAIQGAGQGHGRGALSAPWLVAGWTAWLLYLGGLSLRANLAVRRLRRLARPAAREHRELLSRIAASLGRSSAVGLRVSEDLTTPFLMGMRRPVIILPRPLARSKYAQDLPAILAHEVAHVIRRDLWWIGFANVLAHLLWFHPLVWILRKMHAEACEEACDAIAAGYIRDAGAYSRTLARVALRTAASPAATAGIAMARGPEVIRRLSALRRGFISTPMRRAGLRGLVVLSLLGLGAVTGLRFVVAADEPEGPGGGGGQVAAAQVENPRIETAEFENAEGWIWKLRPGSWKLGPGDANWDTIATMGMVMSLDKSSEEAIRLTLALESEPGREAPEYRPVAFDGSKRRFEFHARPGGSSGSVVLLSYSIEVKSLAPGDLKFIGVEVLTHENRRRIRAPLAAGKARSAGFDTLPFPEIGRPFVFDVTTIDGDRVRSEDYLGKVLLIDYWAKWCGPCMAKMPELKKLYLERRDEGFEVLGVNLDHDRQTARRTIQSEGLSWPNVLAPTASEERQIWNEASGIRTLPRLLLIDREGVLRFDIWPGQCEAKVAELLESK